MTRRRPVDLETVWVEVPEAALEPYEAALGTACATVGFFLDEATGRWRVEGVKSVGDAEGELAGALALARAASGVAAELHRQPVATEDWLARTRAAFPPQEIGTRFAVRGSHAEGRHRPGRFTLTLDAGLAFGSGEHGSTRGCLRALERVAYRRPRRILDLGTGSGILAMAAARMLRRPVLATDIEPWSVRVARDNAGANGVGRLVRVIRANGWTDARVRAAGPYDLVFANILARPLCAMAGQLARHLAPNGTAVLAGLLQSQARMVLAAHRRGGLVLRDRVSEGAWVTLVLRAPPHDPQPRWA